MRVCWVKLNGWPDAFNERIEALLEHVDEIIIIKPKNKDPSTEPTEYFDRVETINLWPSRAPMLQPRILVLLFPVWVIQGIISYFIYAYKKEPCDVFHSLDYPFSALVTKYITMFNHKPCVSSVRGLQVPRYRDDRNPSVAIMNLLMRTLLSMASRHALKDTDYIITKSNYQQNYLKETYNLRRIPMSSIPTGVDYDKFDPSEYTTEEIVLQEIFKGKVPDGPIILFLGQLVPGKGADKFIEYATKTNIDNVSFLMVGQFQNNSFRSKIQKMIEEIEDNNITIHPKYIPFGKIPKLISEVDGVCLLSESEVEGVPRVLQESCVMNTPIIASDVDGINGIFSGKEGCNLISRESSEEFDFAVKEALSSKPDREEFRDELDMERNYGRIADIYRQTTACVNTEDNS